MRLYVETMDAVVVDFDAAGCVKFDNGEWTQPTVQERRALIHAAESEMARLKELLAAIGAEV
jgi:hypothetical protein